MKAAAKALQVLAVLVLLGGAGFLLYTEALPYLTPPCAKPLEYAVGDLDKRFGVSKATISTALAKATAVWNTAAGKTVVEAGTDRGTIPVSLIYTAHQTTANLGTSIDAEQSQYDAAKADVMSLKGQFNAAKTSYEAASTRYRSRSDAYNAEVDSWNKKGGAPPAEYARLKQEGQDLESERKALNAQADNVNALASKVNTAVANLNRIAKEINAQVSTYNKSAGEDFEQGHYVEDANGRRIEIFEYTTTADLTRVLTHELGHALGMNHVENPDSIMYSFNVGDGLTPTPEDIAELRRVCRL